MRDRHSVAVSDRYVLTDQGLAALNETELCKCVIKFVGRALVCEECDTLYGYVSVGVRGNYWEGRPRD